MKVHYPKLYNMAHLFSFNVFTDFKGSNNYILFILSEDLSPSCLVLMIRISRILW